jgi:hypothetical protein
LSPELGLQAPFCPSFCRLRPLLPFTRSLLGTKSAPITSENSPLDSTTVSRLHNRLSTPFQNPDIIHDVPLTVNIPLPPLPPLFPRLHPRHRRPQRRMAKTLHLSSHGRPFRTHRPINKSPLQRHGPRLLRRNMGRYPEESRLHSGHGLRCHLDQSDK